MGVDYLGFLYIEGGASAEALAELVGPGGSHVVPLEANGRAKSWLAIDVNDQLLHQGIDDELLEMLRGWSESLGCRVAVLEKADYDFELVIFDGGDKLRHLHFRGGLWQRVAGKRQPWEKLFFERADWTDTEEHGEDTPEGRAIARKRVVKGSCFPGGVMNWVEDAGFPLNATHNFAGGGPSAGELAKAAATTGGIGLGIMLALFLGTGLFALLLAQCGIFDG